MCSDIAWLLNLDLEPEPRSFELKGLEWIHRAEPFLKPSPDQIIEEKKAGGRREPIVVPQSKESKSLLHCKPSCQPAAKPPKLFEIPSTQPQSIPDLKDEIPTLNVVFLGHKKSGKSSILGRILYDFGYFDDKLLHRFRRDSSKANIENGEFAWAVDLLLQEKQLGTVSCFSESIRTEQKVLHLLDTPGSSEYFTEYISGAAQADLCVIVVDSTVKKKRIESRVVEPTKELAFLARSYGVSQVIVAVSRSEVIPQEIESSVLPVIQQAGFKPENIRFVPVSPVEGVNVTLRASDQPCLFELIQEAEPPKPNLQNLVFRVEDCYRLVHGSLLGHSISGKILSGFIKPNSKVQIPQVNFSAQIKEVEKGGQKVNLAFAGDSVDFTLKKFTGNFEKIKPGQVVSSSQLKLPQKLVIRGVTGEIKAPVTKNMQMLLHMGSTRVPVKVTRITKEIQGRQVKPNPRALWSKKMGELEVLCERPTPCATFKENPTLSRVVLTYSGKIMLAGIVMNTL